jgi:hypothetical protein
MQVIVCIYADLWDKVIIDLLPLKQANSIFEVGYTI